MRPLGWLAFKAALAEARPLTEALAEASHDVEDKR
jgi:nitrogen fixation NifU-like protein